MRDMRDIRRSLTADRSQLGKSLCGFALTPHLHQQALDEANNPHIATIPFVSFLLFSFPIRSSSLTPHATQPNLKTNTIYCSRCAPQDETHLPHESDVNPTPLSKGSHDIAISPSATLRHAIVPAKPVGRLLSAVLYTSHERRVLDTATSIPKSGHWPIIREPVELNLHCLGKHWAIIVGIGRCLVCEFRGNVRRIQSISLRTLIIKEHGESGAHTTLGLKVGSYFR